MRKNNAGNSGNGGRINHSGITGMPDANQLVSLQSKDKSTHLSFGYVYDDSVCSDANACNQEHNSCAHRRM